MDSRHHKPVKVQASKIGNWKKCLQQLLTENREQDPVHEGSEEQEGPSPYSALLLERLTHKKSFSGSSPRCSARSSTEASPRPRNCASLDMSPRVASSNGLASPNSAVFPALHHRAFIGSVASTRPSSFISTGFGGPQHQSPTASSSLQGASTRPSSVVSTAVFRGREGNDGLLSSRSSTPWDRLADSGSNIGTPRASRWGRQRTQGETATPRRKSLELMTSIDSAAEVASQLLARDQDAANQKQGSLQPSINSSTLDGQGSPPAAPLQPRPSSLRPPGMAGRTLAGSGPDPDSHDSNTQAFANAFLNAAPTQRTAAVPDSRAASDSSRAGRRPPALQGALPPKSPTASANDPTSNCQAPPSRPAVPPLALPGKLPPIHLNSSVHSSNSSSLSARSSSTPRVRGSRLQAHHPTAPLMPSLDLSGLCTPRPERLAEGGQGEGVQRSGKEVEDGGRGEVMQGRVGASRDEGVGEALGMGQFLDRSKSHGERVAGRGDRDRSPTLKGRPSITGRRSLHRVDTASSEREEQGLGGTSIRLQPRISQRA